MYTCDWGHICQDRCLLLELTTWTAMRIAVKGASVLGEGAGILGWSWLSTAISAHY